MKIMSSMPNFPVSSLFEDLLLFASCYTTLTVMTSRTVLDIVKKEGGKYDFANQYSLIVKILIKKYKKYYKNYEKIKKIMKNIILIRRGIQREKNACATRRGCPVIEL